MNKIFTLVFVIFLTASYFASAQKIRFNDTTNVWVTCGSDPYTWMVDKYGNIIKPSYKGRISKDTVVNGYSWYFHTRFGTWIREDSTGQKFYFTSSFSTERVFMDFTMNIGDTLQ